MKNELERIRDQLKCSLNMGGLKGSAEWAVGEIDRLLVSLPVGVPDALTEVERKAILGLIELASHAFHVADNGEDVGGETISVPRCDMDDLGNALDSLDELPDDMPGYTLGPSGRAEWALRRFFGGTTIAGQDGIAPTVKAEQAQAPSLPAAGSAVEEVEQARFIEWARSEHQVRPDEDLNLRHKDVVENRKGWMARAALSAQQSAPERVSVPDGYALVPVEPTPEMIAALADNVREVSGFFAGFTYGYRAMLAAALSAQQSAPELDEDACFCGNAISLQMVSGGGHSSGLLGEVTLKIDGEYVKYLRVDQQSAPERVSVPVEFRKVADKILAKLIRFADCAEDFEAGGVDIGRDWLDTLTHLGLLERIQRSPALWQTTDEADAIIDAQRAILASHGRGEA